MKPLFCLSNDFIGRELLLEGRYEKAELEWLEKIILRRESALFDTIVDVGANIGNHAVFLSQYAKRVIAFEPNPITTLVLRANLALSQTDNIEVLEVALGESDAWAELVLYVQGNLGGSQLHTCKCGPTSRHATVRVRTGDTVLREVCPLGRIDLLKIDVEGAELAALSGLENTLRQDRPLVLFEGNSRGERERVMNLLETFGYNQFGYVAYRQAYSQIRVIRWLQKLTDGDAKMFPLKRSPDAAIPMCLAFQDHHRDRYDLNFDPVK